MAANQAPIFTKAPRYGHVTIPQATACVKSDGSSSGSGNEKMYCVFEAGADGSYLGRLRFTLGAVSASILSTVTTLRAFLTSVTATEGAAVSGATTTSDTFFHQDIAVGAITCGQPTAATAFFEIPFGFGIQYGISVIVTQHVAMANACTWMAALYGGDY